MVRISPELYAERMNSRRALNDNLTVGGTDSLELDGLGSGSTIPDTYIALVDKFGQIVGSDSRSRATLNINTNSNVSAYVPVLTGTTTITAANGMFVFANVSFTAGPNSNYGKFCALTIMLRPLFINNRD